MNSDLNRMRQNAARLNKKLKTLLEGDLLVIEFHKEKDLREFFGKFEEVSERPLDLKLEYSWKDKNDKDYSEFGKWIILDDVYRIDSSPSIRDCTRLPPVFEELKEVGKLGDIKRTRQAQFNTLDIQDIHIEPYQISRYFCKKALLTSPYCKGYFNDMVGFANFFAQIPFRKITKTRDLLKK